MQEVKSSEVMFCLECCQDCKYFNANMGGFFGGCRKTGEVFFAMTNIMICLDYKCKGGK